MNCKVGDIAVVVRGRTCDKHVGRLVKILEAELGRPGYWLIESVGETPLEDDWGPVKRTHCADSRLRPIRPDELPEIVVTREQIPAW